MTKILETDRLILREFEEKDLFPLKEVIHNPDGGKCEESHAHRWIDWCISSYKKYGFGQYAVIYKETNELVGSIGLSMQMIDDELKPELGYHVRSEYHRKGITKEASKALKDYFFTNFKYDELFSYMDEDNVASYKTAESNGMKYLHLYTTKSGEVCRVYSITRSEWLHFK